MTVWPALIPHLVHDVRTLVRKGLSSAQLVERTAGAALEPEAAALLKSCIDAQRDLNQLVTRVAVLADAERPRDAPDPIGLDMAILGAKVHWQIALEEASAEFHADGIPEYLVPQQVLAILVELVGNSVRYRHPERPLKIQFEAVQAGDVVQISVQDNGSGWNPAYQTKLMQPLEILDANRGGFGLGLAIALALTESFGGNLRGETNATGSCFVMEVPILTQ